MRVAYYWAGVAYGALHHPRVGHAVLVAFHEGNPEWPVVVGRVYSSDQHPPPYDPSARPTVSTVKSQSAPKAVGFNELRFEDLAGKEEIFLHAQRELNEVVLGSHSTSVGGDQSNSVGGNQSNTVAHDRTHTVNGMELNMIGGDRNTTIGVVEKLDVGADRSTTIGNNELLTVTVARETVVGATDNLTVGASRNVTVGGSEHHDVTGPFVVKAAGCTLSMAPGMLLISNGAAQGSRVRA